MVELDARAEGDALCVWAWGDGAIVFSERYDGQGEAPSGSLTFVAGARVSDEVRVGARVLRGGAIAGEGRRAIRFADGLTQLTIPVRRCTPSDRGPGAALQSIGMLESVTRVSIGDLDGDGRDELAGWTADGTLAVLRDGERVDTLTGAGAGEVVTIGDADGDCLADLVLVDESAVQLVRAAGTAPQLEVASESGARDAAFGAFLDGRATLALATATGLVVLPLGGGERRIDGAFDAIAADDLSGDGFDDAVASGAGGTRYFVGGPSGLTEVPAGLPPSVAAATGPLVIADLDGDGRGALAAADGASVRFAVNRGDGLLEERGAGSPIALAAPVAMLRAGDVDGDCRDEVIAIAMDGSAVVARLSEGLPAVVDGAWPSALDAAVGDVDGDGARELLWLTIDGEVRAWQP